MIVFNVLMYSLSCTFCTLLSWSFHGLSRTDTDRLCHFFFACKECFACAKRNNDANPFSSATSFSLPVVLIFCFRRLIRCFVQIRFLIEPQPNEIEVGVCETGTLEQRNTRTARIAIHRRQSFLPTFVAALIIDPNRGRMGKVNREQRRFFGANHNIPSWTMALKISFNFLELFLFFVDSIFF